MKCTLLILAAMLAGCGTTRPDPAATARQHERNVVLAQRLGYAVVTENGRAEFCAASAGTGSHIVPPCMSDAEWERLHPVAAGTRDNSSGVVESGRSSFEGTLGH